MPTINKTIIKPKHIKHTTSDNTDWSIYYNTVVWKRLRQYYISQHPLCEDCLENGIIKPADEVHHMIPFGTGRTEQERYDLLTDENNLRSVCLECHHKYHKDNLFKKRK